MRRLLLRGFDLFRNILTIRPQAFADIGSPTYIAFAMKIPLRLLFAIFCLFCALPGGLSAQTLTSRLMSAWQKFEHDPQLKYAGFSLTVVDCRTGEVLFSKNGTTGLAPASTLKTITSATAYYKLGPGYRYTTSLAWTGTLNAEGTLNGDLLIKGAGDPTLGSPRYPETTEEHVLREWVAAVKAAGIKRIDGRILGDDRLFGTESIPGGWIWSDMGNYYGAGAPSLTWRENQFDMVFEPASRPGEPVRSVKTDPAFPFLRLVNEVITGIAGSGDGVIAYSAPYQPLIYLRGTHGIDLKKRIGASVPDPALDAAFRLKEALSRQSVSSGEVSTTRLEQLAGRPVSATVHPLPDPHISPPLEQIIYWLNQKSINLYAELLLRQLALTTGKEPTFSNGVNVITDFWNSKLGIDKNALRILDGSGLSPENRVTTTAIATILSSVQSEPWFPGYYESLPINNGLHMKSGSIQNTLAYAGYLPSGSGMLAFSIIVNNYNGSTPGIRQKMFNLLGTIK
jgi:D-alanyl-D-alanine carboxypeptidase/D-alanyl-D-alanine-endopeptidase (penicillin-binding protein 4)